MRELDDPASLHDRGQVVEVEVRRVVALLIGLDFVEHLAQDRARTTASSTSRDSSRTCTGRGSRASRSSACCVRDSRRSRARCRGSWSSGTRSQAGHGMSSRFRMRVREPVDAWSCPVDRQPRSAPPCRRGAPGRESRRTSVPRSSAAASSTIVSSPSPITQTSTSGVESSVNPAVAVMCSPPATIGMLGKAAADHLDHAPDLGPVLREHAADADEVGVRLDPLDDLLAAQADRHDLVVEQRRHLEGVFSEAVDDPRRVTRLPQARGQVRRPDRRRQRPGVGPGRNEQRRPQDGNSCHEWMRNSVHEKGAWRCGHAPCRQSSKLEARSVQSARAASSVSSA